MIQWTRMTALAVAMGLAACSAPQLRQTQERILQPVDGQGLQFGAEDYSTFLLPQAAPAAAFDVTSCVVYFELASAKVGADQAATLDRCAQYFAAQPALGIALTGLADERGASTYNQKLAAARAKATADALVARGIAADRIAINVVGEEAAPAPGGDAAWSRSRRVEIAQR